MRVYDRVGKLYLIKEESRVGAQKKKDDKIIQMAGKERKRNPASDAEKREQQLINAAVNLAEKQLLEGTAAAPVITHYLKLASKKEALERQIMANQAELLAAKKENMNREKESEVSSKAAIEALKSYAPK